MRSYRLSEAGELLPLHFDSLKAAKDKAKQLADANHKFVIIHLDIGVMRPVVEWQQWAKR